MPRSVSSFAIALVAFTVALLGANAASAQLQMGGGLTSHCAEIEALRAKGDLPGARVAAGKCLEGLEQELEGEIGRFIEEQIGDWKRTRFEQNAAMGMRNATFEYKKGNTRVRGNLMGGGSGRGLGGALSGFARMGMMGGGGRELKVANVPATIMPNGQFMITFADGTILTFESSQFKTPDEALAGFGDLIDQFPVAKIRDALGGR